MKNTLKNLFKKPLAKYGFLIVLLIGLIYSGSTLLNRKSDEPEEENKIVKNVLVATVDNSTNGSSTVETVGTVQAETSIDVVSTAAGTLRGVYFSIGDEVTINKTLALLHNDSSLTSLNNAKTNLNNSESSLLATERISGETIRQTEIGVEQARVGVKNAQKSIDLATLSLTTAKDNLANALNLQAKRVEDLKGQAVINFNAYLSGIFNAKDQVESFLNIKTSTPLNSAIGAKDTDTIQQAKIDYTKVNNDYQELLLLNPSITSIDNDITKMISALKNAETMLSSVINVLDNSVSGNSYPESTISSQKSNFLVLRNSLIQSQNAAKAESQALASIKLTNKSELDSLNNAISAAEAQLSIAKTAKENAEVALKNTEQSVNSAIKSKEQQLLGAKTQIDNASGQYRLVQSQVGDLIIKAPINGKITQKYVENGAEINPGQKIAEISQTKMLKVIVNLSSEDIYRVELGQKVKVNDDYEAIIALINPAADPASKKVKVEILFDNKDQKLLPGTFVDVSIPVKELAKSSTDSFYIPLRTLIITQNEKFVFVNQNNTAVKKIVTTGQTENALVEIISGLSEGDELIIDGGKSLEDGDAISVSISE